MSLRRNKCWSVQEDAILSSRYKDSSAAELALLLGRSKQAVERRVGRLGLATKMFKTDLEGVRGEFLAVGYTLLSTEYPNSYTKLRFECDKGHHAELTWNKFHSGRRCPRCYYDRHEMFSRVKQEFTNEGYALVSKEQDYAGSQGSLDFLCPNGHEYNISWNSFSQGQRCGKCAHLFSRAEKEIFSFISELLPAETVVENARGVISPFELDIYLPQRKLAIEYCGLRWHGEAFSARPRNYHYIKYVKCLEKEIRLITIFEDEYLERPEVVLGRIKHALGIYEERLYARKLKFAPVSLKEAKQFLGKVHLQGYSPCKYRFGLFSGTRLVQAMTFGRVTRAHADSGGVLEMKRLASLPGVAVIGGASKLFKRAFNILGGEFNHIKSYCDMRWADPFSTVYDKLGFELVGVTKYTPHYTLKQKRYRNQTLSKKQWERNSGKTEWELRRDQGFDRIWDCGHRTYTYTRGD